MRVGYGKYALRQWVALMTRTPLPDPAQKLRKYGCSNRASAYALLGGDVEGVEDHATSLNNEPISAVANQRDRGIRSSRRPVCRSVYGATTGCNN